MTHIITLSARDTIAELKQAIRHSNDEAQKTRIRAIISIKEGRTRTKTAQIFNVTRTTLRGWVTVYNEKGIDALKMSKGGRPKGNHRWDASIFDTLIAEVKKGEHCWSVPLMQEWITERHRKDIPESTVWYHLKVRNFSYKSARPHPYKGDVKAQKAFKKRGS